jgi:hypothetical protein
MTSIFRVQMETVCSSERLVATYQTAYCHNPEEHNMNHRRYEYLKSQILKNSTTRSYLKEQTNYSN